MRVVCIRDGLHKPDSATVKRGNIYTVVGEKEVAEKIEGEYRTIGGLYYYIVEIDCFAHSRLFVAINEDQQDETEFEREYNKEKVTA